MLTCITGFSVQLLSTLLCSADDGRIVFYLLVRELVNLIWLRPDMCERSLLQQEAFTSRSGILLPLWLRLPLTFRFLKLVASNR